MICDWDCLEAARRGGEEAWRELFRRYYTSLVRMTLLITGSQESAKDIAQETFVRLLRSRTDHRAGSFKAYLNTVAFRLALKEKKRQHRHLNLDHQICADPSPSPLDDAEHRDRQDHIRAAILALADSHREILVLRFYGEHSYDEIAQITGIPLGTVKSRIFNAVKECRKTLQEKGVI
jgi:RNA polymerase sigma factor (sigma-70 family)